ncbi:MAG: hypothetical protein PHH58_03185 [Rhodoferax sp.]|nr:hypothetical protein [Rhodoferax sp.]
MKHPTDPSSWNIQEALAVAYSEFTQRFGADLLHQAFVALTLHSAQTMQAHRALDADMGNYISSVLDARGAGLTEWLTNARADRDQDAMLLDIGVRWWRARDDLARQPQGTRVPCTYAPGATSLHSGLQLLAQMLYRGSAPDTAPPAISQTPTTRV